MQQVPEQINFRRRKGRFYLLPNLLTTIGLLSGFYAIIASVNGQFSNAAIAIIIAGLFDGIDGRVARLTGTASRFGMEYDSLCDLISFGLAPGLLSYQLVLHQYGRYGWLAAFLYLATTALRLARFNSQQNSTTSVAFTGLPCPAAAGIIASAVLFCSYMGFNQSYRDVFLLIIVYVLAYLMVSTFPYPSFKKFESQRIKKFHSLVGMVLLIVIIAAEPQITLLVIGMLYMFAGPFLSISRRISKLYRTNKKEEKKATS